MIVNLDMDGVIIDFNRRVAEQLAARGFKQASYEGITRFDLEMLWGPEAGSAALELINSDSVYDGLEPEDGALEAIARLRADGFEIRVLTNAVIRIRGGHYLEPRLANAKLRWLLARGFSAEEIVIAYDKASQPGDVLAEDRAETVEEWLKTGRPAILFDRPWNRWWQERNDLAPRVANWAELESAIRALATKVQERGETVLEEAARLVDRGQRQIDYGHPKDNYRALADVANALLQRKLKEDLDAMDLVRLIAAMKLVRDSVRGKRDNWTDLAGYARVGERVAAALNLWNEEAVP